eukprot:Gb_13751 [translate_table: standard]
MFGKKTSIVRATKVRPEFEEEEKPTELHVSLSIVSSAPSSMQQVQSVDSLQTIGMEQNEKHNLSGGNVSTRKQLCTDCAEVKFDISSEDVVLAENSSLIQDSSICLLDGANSQHGQSDCSEKINEAACKFVDTSHALMSNVECVISCQNENLDTGRHICGQNAFTAYYCGEKESVSQQATLVELTQTSRDVSSSGDKSQSQASIFITTCKDGSKGKDVNAANGAIHRTISSVSTDSYAECCRICQQQTEEALVELGCECRGELAKVHISCTEVWFNNKGSNKCEICQHVATNIPAPASQPVVRVCLNTECLCALSHILFLHMLSMQHFWVWRMNGPYGGSGGLQRRQVGTRFHPLWAALLILIAGLLFDVLISIFLGASALPVNIIIGVLVILGLGTAARLIVECWHERNVTRSLQRMEIDANLDLYQERPPAQI